MRNYLLAAAFVLTVSVPSPAAPVACVAGTLADYIALGTDGCTLGPATVADFESGVLLLSAVEILPADVTVTPLAGIGLDFGVTRSAAAGDLFDILIRYSLSGASLSENTLSMTGTSATGDGVVLAIEDKCTGGTYAGADPTTPCSDTPVTAIVVQDAFGLVSPDVVSFPVRSFFDVFVEIPVDGGLSGSAEIDGAVRTAFASAPEPSMMLILGFGLAAALARRRRPQ
jgi:hypothetical protein